MCSFLSLAAKGNAVGDGRFEVMSRKSVTRKNVDGSAENRP